MSRNCSGEFHKKLFQREFVVNHAPQLISFSEIEVWQKKFAALLKSSFEARRAATCIRRSSRGRRKSPTRDATSEQWFVGPRAAG